MLAHRLRAEFFTAASSFKPAGQLPTKANNVVMLMHRSTPHTPQGLASKEHARRGQGIVTIIPSPRDGAGALIPLGWVALVGRILPPIPYQTTRALHG